MRWSYLILVFGTLVPNVVEAAVINYSEEASEDLPGEFLFLSELPVLNLGVGENKVSGELTLSIESITNPQASDFDSFIFTLPSDTELTSVIINTSLLPGSAEDFNGIGYELINPLSGDSPLVNVISEQLEGLVPIPSTNISLFDSTLPVNPGEYLFRNSYLTYQGEPTEDNDSITAAYSISFNVESKPIPEPSSTLGMLVMGGLGG